MASLTDSLDVVAWLATAVAAINWGLVELSDTNLLSDTLGLSGETLTLAYLAIGVLGIVDLALLLGKLESGIVSVDEPLGLAVAIGTGVAAVNWGSSEVLGTDLLSDTLGLSGDILSWTLIAIGILGAVSLYWLVLDLTGSEGL